MEAAAADRRSRPPRAPTGARATTHVPRINYRECLTPVRAFYLDLAHWAVEDPARWAPWVAPCPIGAEEINRRKDKRHRKARMDARTRERLPVLPALVASVDRHRKDTAERLEQARQAAPGSTFSAAGQTLIRLAPTRSASTKVWAEDPATGQRRDLGREEDHAFWAFAVVEILRATGIRIEELTELSHHSLVQYRLPGTGEVVPLLQIAPSKTDAERLAAWSAPNWPTCSAAIIARSAAATARSRWSPPTTPANAPGPPPLPLLFQRRVGTENRAIPHRHDPRPAQRGARPHRPDRPCHRPAAALHPARLPPAVHHRRDPQRAAAAHRPGHRRPPRHQRHHGLQGRLPRRGDPGPPGVPRPPPRAAAHRGIPHPDRRGMAGVPRPLRTPQGLHRHLRPRVRDPLHPRARLRPLLNAVARPRPARPPRRDPRQPARPHRRSRTRRLARRGRRTPGQPRRRRGQAHPDRRPHRAGPVRQSAAHPDSSRAQQRHWP